MERNEFLRKNLEEKLIVIFDEIQEVKQQTRPRQGFVVEKDYYKISEVAAIMKVAYNTVERRAQDLGFNPVIRNGVKVLTTEQIEQMLHPSSTN